MGGFLADRVKNLVYSEIAAVRYRVNEMKARGIDVVRFDTGDVGFEAPESARYAAIDAINEGKNRYPPTAGITELREAIAEKLRIKNKMRDVSPDDVFVTNGGMQGLFCAFGVVLNKGDEIIFNTPLWSPVVGIANIFEPVVRYAMTTKDFRLDIDNIKAVISKRSKIVCINTPNNPTGRVYDRKSLEELANVCLEHNLFLVSDEPYEDVTFGCEHFSIGSLDGMLERMAAVYSFSKSSSITGWRVGYVVTKNREIKEALKNFILHSTNGVNVIAQYGALAAIKDLDYTEIIRDEYAKRRSTLLDGLKSIEGVELVESQGTYYVFPSFKRFVPSGENDSGGHIFNLLMENGVAVVPGRAFRCEDHVRMSFSDTNLDEIKKGVKRIKSALGNL